MKDTVDIVSFFVKMSVKWYTPSIASLLISECGLDVEKDIL